MPSKVSFVSKHNQCYAGETPAKPGIKLKQNQLFWRAITKLEMHFEKFRILLRCWVQTCCEISPFADAIRLVLHLVALWKTLNETLPARFPTPAFGQHFWCSLAWSLPCLVRFAIVFTILSHSPRKSENSANVISWPPAAKVITGVLFHRKVPRGNNW